MEETGEVDGFSKQNWYLCPVWNPMTYFNLHPQDDIVRLRHVNKMLTLITKLMQPLSQYHDMTIPYNIYLTESFLFIIKQSSDQLYHRKNRNSLHSFVCPRESSHLQINLLLNGVSLTNPSIFVSLYHLKGHEVSASIISIKIDICTTCTG